MSVRVLQAYVEVARQRHFGRAAGRLGMTQSGLSQLIKGLENSVGATLITRTTRSVSLTDVGEVYLENALEILQAHRLADLRMQNVLKGEEGTVRLGFVASAALSVVPKLAAKVQEEAPKIRLSLSEVTSEDQILQIKAGDIDVGVMREIQQSTGLVIKPLLIEPLLLAVSNSHPLAHQKRVQLKDLSSQGFIMSPRTRVSYLHDHIHRLCNGAGFRPNIVEQAVQFTTILGLVSSNAGVAIVPEAVTVIKLPNVSFLKITDPEAVSKIFIAREVDEQASSAARRLVDIATSSL